MQKNETELRRRPRGEIVTTAKAGKFEISVSDPSPIWCRLAYDGDVFFTFSHLELTDLIYAAQKALEMARMKLPKSERECELR